MKAAIITVTLALFAFACVALFAGEKVGRDQPLTKAMLAGTYTIESSQKGDEVTPPDHLAGSLVTFTENTIVATDGDKKEIYAAKFELDHSKTPAVIHMVTTTPEFKGAQASGLIQGDGRTVKLIYALPHEGEKPTEFKAAKGQRLMVLKKIEKTASVPVEKE